MSQLLSVITNLLFGKIKRPDTKMPELIQMLYGTIAALSFYNLFADHKSQVDYQIDCIWPFIGLDSNFNFFTFLFTFFILAHDWHAFFSQHLYDKFWEYTPQILSLIFLSQMFVCANNGYFQAWFIFGLWHTVGNILNGICLYRYTGKINGISVAKYASHFIICLWGYQYATNKPAVLNYVLVGLTAVIVIIFWCIGKEKKQKIVPPLMN